jgi:GNAT superfamily N-acetyltransferase
MNIFTDTNTHLTWYSPTMFTKDKDLKPEGVRESEEFKTLLNSSDWNNGGIAEFITGGRLQLGDLFYSRCKQPYSLMYYAFDNGNCVGAMMMKKNIIRTTYKRFHDYVVYCEENNIDRKDQYMFLSDAKRVLTQTELSDYDIDYLAIPQRYQGKGIGTRIVTSLHDNIHFFTGEDRINILTAMINDKNSRCIKLFNKHGYYPLYVEKEARYHATHTVYHYVMGGENENTGR